jgi:NAD-dependent protein deacetylases, SIR2 family
MDDKLINILNHFKNTEGNITILTGAGISSESGIPTFRGKDGYWTVGSKEYHPEEMATLRMFKMSPYEIWQWYLYRKTVCAQAEPNSGHRAIVELEKIFQDRFVLITQNVDGLHLRAGNTPDRTYQIHGNLNFMRCSDECSGLIIPVPNEIPFKDKTAPITETEKKLLICSQCGAISRPHVLWFDECYDEKFFRFYSSLQKAEKTDLLLVVGTSGATNLPMQVGVTVVHRGGAVIDINPEPNPFSQMATSVTNGYHASEKSSETLPQIVEFLRQ